MLSKIRSTAVVFVAVSSFIATSALPAAQAKPIDPHRNVTTKYAVNKKVVNGPCHELLEMLNESLRELDKAHREGNDQQVKAQREQANNEYQTGYENGCGFAS
jgi:flagellar biosynthesis/type III secretory pathway protein FliH